MAEFILPSSCKQNTVHSDLMLTWTQQVQRPRDDKTKPWIHKDCADVCPQVSVGEKPNQILKNER